MPKSSAVEAISSFQRNDMSLRARREREEAEKRSTISAQKPKKSAKTALSMGPTPERIAKGDLVRTTGGSLTVEGTLDRLRNERTKTEPAKAELLLKRLHHRMTLDFDPVMNDRMYEAGRKYEDQAYLAGLSGIAAQNLTSAGSGGDPASTIPISEAAAGARLRIRKAWSIMGSKVGAAVHAILVDGKDAESVGRESSSYKSANECRTAGTTTLRIGLWMLVNANWA